MQKVALKIILKEKYESYQNALKVLELETLEERRNELAIKFAKKCLTNPKMKHLFPPSKGTHTMKQRNHKIFHVIHANTESMQHSLIVYMLNLLNTEARQKMEINTLWND